MAFFRVCLGVSVGGHRLFMGWAVALSLFLLPPVSLSQTWTVFECLTVQLPSVPSYARDLLRVSAANLQADDPFLDTWELLGANVFCNEGDSRVELLVLRGEGVHGLMLEVMRSALDQTRVAGLPRAIANSGVSDSVAATMLYYVAGWVGVSALRVSPDVAMASTEWALNSKNPDLHKAAVLFRAMAGVQDSLLARVGAIVDCAESNGYDHSLSAGCVNEVEFFTVDVDIVRSLWLSVSSAGKKWLTLWGRKNTALFDFYLDILVDETRDVQDEILQNVFTGSDVPDEKAIAAGRLLLQQAFDDPAHRPPMILIPVGEGTSLDAQEIEAMGDGPHTTTLRFAFDVLSSDADAYEIMAKLPLLEHSWISTQAGIWLVRHGFVDEGWQALKYALQGDGVPLVSVIAEIAREPLIAADGIHVILREALEKGGLGKWRVFSTYSYFDYFDNPITRGIFFDRVRGMPARVRDARALLNGDSVSREFAAQVFDAITHEVDSIFRLMRHFSFANDVGVDELLVFLARQDEDDWQLLAVRVAVETSRLELVSKFESSMVDRMWLKYGETVLSPYVDVLNNSRPRYDYETVVPAPLE